MFDKICLIEHLNIKNNAVNISKINLAFLSFFKYCILLGKRAFFTKIQYRRRLHTLDECILHCQEKINKLQQCLFFKLFNNNNVCLG